MQPNAPISKIMTTDVQSVQRGEPMSRVRQLLSENAFHHVPVLDGKKVVGMVSSQEIFRLSFDEGSTDVRTMDAWLDHQFTLEQVMSRDLDTLPTNARVRDAATMMANGQRHSVLVTNEAEELAGIVTSTDLIRYLHDLV